MNEPIDIKEYLPASGAKPRVGEQLLNTQLWENSTVKDSEAAERYAENPDALYNDTTPQLAIKRESYKHRIAIMLAAKGTSQREIAKLLGMTEPWVSQLLRQPWARETLLEEIRKVNNGDEITMRLASEVNASIDTIVAVRDGDSAEVKPSDRLAAAKDILDRFLGKPTQRVETKADITHHSGDIADVDRQLAEVEREEKRLLGDAAVQRIADGHVVAGSAVVADETKGS